MEQFNVKEDWIGFLNGDLYVNCKTQSLAIEFLEYCHKQGLKWSDGSPLIDFSCWSSGYKEGINYKLFDDGRIVYTSYREPCTVEFNGFKTQQLLTPDVFMFKLLSDVKPNKSISKFPTETTKETIEVIYHRSETIVIIKTGGKHYRGVSRCHIEDTYNKEVGFGIALERAREKQMEGRY